MAGDATAAAAAAEPAAAEPAAPPRDRRAGDEVVLEGLQARRDLNGKQAKVVSWDPVSGRYAVALQESTEQVKVRDANLVAGRKMLVTVVTGLRDSGKSQLARHAIRGALGGRGQSLRVAYLADHECFEAGGGAPPELAAEAVSRLEPGCSSSTRRLDFAAELLRLARPGCWEHVLVETCGSAEPRKVAELWGDKAQGGGGASSSSSSTTAKGRKRRSLPERLCEATALASTISVVDGPGALRRLVASAQAEEAEDGEDVGEAKEEEELKCMVNHLEFADLVVVAGAEKMSGHEVQAIQEFVRLLNPDALVMLASGAQVPCSEVFQRRGEETTKKLIQAAEKGADGLASPFSASSCLRSCCVPVSAKRRFTPGPRLMPRPRLAPAAGGASGPADGDDDGGGSGRAASPEVASTAASLGRLAELSPVSSVTSLAASAAAAEDGEGQAPICPTLAPAATAKVGDREVGTDMLSFTYRPERPFHPGRVARVLDGSSAMPAPLLRATGTAWVASRPLRRGQWSTVDGQTILEPGPEWWATEPRQRWPESVPSLLQGMGLLEQDGRWSDPECADCFTDLEVLCRREARVDVQASLDRLLVSDAEAAMGPACWVTLEENGLPEWPGRPGDDALSCLALTGVEGLLEALCARGADVNARNGFNHGTGLHAAALKDRRRSVEVLLRFRADPCAVAVRGMQPLHLAASSEVVDMLLAAGADVGAVDEHGHTPLHHAGSLGKSAVAATLLQHGAKVDALTPMHETPLDLARAAGAGDVARLLAEASA